MAMSLPMRATPALVLAACAWLSGCAHYYTGAGRGLAPQALQSEPGWISVASVSPLLQHAEQDCGPTALAMVLAYWSQGRVGVPELALDESKAYSAGELRDRARTLGFSAFVLEGTLVDIQHELLQKRPVIVGMAKPTARGPVAHFEVVVGLHPDTQRIATLDPALGFRQNSLTDFTHEWVLAGQILLTVLGPTPSAAARHEPQVLPRLASSSRSEPRRVRR